VVALESTSEGLPFGLTAFEFELTPSPRTIQAPRNHGDVDQHSVPLIKGADTCTALVMRDLG
jgi:hypothetical protein